MAGPTKCAHPACNCTVEPKGPLGVKLQLLLQASG